MSDADQTYEVGEYIVHLIYGVGQVKKIERRPIGGAKRLCYRVRTDDGVFWLPTVNADNRRVRPIASPKHIRNAIKILQKNPKKMSSNYKSRRKRIREVILDGDLSTDMELVRDLNARQFKKGLNMTEQDALDTIIKRFLKEWSLTKGIKIQEARQKLDQFLQKSRSKPRQDAVTL